jgi:RHS repeat-associated protein
VMVHGMPTVDRSILCEYRYDPLDRLTAISGQSSLAPLQRFYLQKRLVTQIQGSRSLSLMQAPNALLAQLEEQGAQAQCSLFATDRQQSVLHTQIGNQRRTSVYMPYGFHALQSREPGAPGFNGESPDAVTGHYLSGSGYRAFNPIFMRFNSPDSLSPFGKGGLNSYVYCAGDPVNNSDPSGHFVSKLPVLFKALSHMIETPVAVSETAGFFNRAVEVAQQGLTLKSVPHPPMSAARQALDDALKPMEGKDRFVRYLSSVNRNFASHRDDILSMSHARKYADLAEKVEAGSISNTYAHYEAAVVWFEKFVVDRQASGFVGAVFNAGGAATSGPIDHALRATGAALRRAP